MYGHKQIAFLFTLCLLVRMAFHWFMPHDHFDLFTDSYRYDELSDRILSGNFSLDVTSYIIAPLYPYTLAFFKLIGGSGWQTMVVAFQFLLVALSTVYLYKTSLLLFDSKNAALLTGLMYIFYPLTLWYNFTLVQETSFQAYFIFFIYFFLRISKYALTGDVIRAAIFFGLALWTKSHILMLLPLLIIILGLQKKWKQGFVFASIVVLLSIPHGLVNYKLHEVFTISSHGNATLFLLGHSDDTYPCLIGQKRDMRTYSDAGCDNSIAIDADYVFPIYGLVNTLTPKERNALRFKIATEWIKDNNVKFLELKWHGLKRFIVPGLDSRLYKLPIWLASLFGGLLIYLPAYFILARNLREDWWQHLLPVALLFTIAVIFIVFFPINRFRVITLEPLLMVYAGLFYQRLLPK